MLESLEARAKLRCKLETWPDDRKSPITINQGLELLNMVERLEKENEELRANNYGPEILNDPQALTASYFAGRMAEGREIDSKMDKLLEENRQLEKEADWLATRCAKACIHKTEDCAFQPAYFMDKPCYGENCKKSFCSLDKNEWREAARKAVLGDK